jgi:hypothetical protein
MEVHFTPEQQAQLAQMAADQGIDAEHLVQSAALRLLQGETELQTEESQSLVERMRAIRARIKPDPDGWTTRDYVLYGRR